MRNFVRHSTKDSEQKIPIHHADFLTWTPTKANYDLIVSGVPMSLLAKETQQAMLQKTYGLLAPGGTYVHILYSHALADSVEALFWNVDYRYCLFDFPFTCAIRATKDKHML
jgi:phospholipid N-methyltransferase